MIPELSLWHAKRIGVAALALSSAMSLIALAPAAHACWYDPTSGSSACPPPPSQPPITVNVNTPEQPPVNVTVNNPAPQPVNVTVNGSSTPQDVTVNNSGTPASAPAATSPAPSSQVAGVNITNTPACVMPNGATAGTDVSSATTASATVSGASIEGPVGAGCGPTSQVAGITLPNALPVTGGGGAA